MYKILYRKADIVTESETLPTTYVYHYELKMKKKMKKAKNCHEN